MSERAGLALGATVARMHRKMERPIRDVRRVGLVLAGGGARAAYEVGVIHYLVHDLARELGRDVPLDVLSGTSAGAINACSLAALADEPKQRADLLARNWCSLRIENVLRPDAGELVSLAAGLLGVRSKSAHGGLINPKAVRKLLTDTIPFERIGAQLSAGRVQAVCVSATHVGSGKTVVFVQRTDSGMPAWGSDTTVEPRGVTLRLEHALASAAIPFLFPAVSIDGQFYCDGALRQNVPLSPARRLGCDSLVVVSPHHRDDAKSTLDEERERAFAGPTFLLGKTLNALLLDRLDGDVDRLNRINQVLEAGCREYGPEFLDALNRQLGRNELERMRPVETVVIRPSQNLGVIASKFLRSSTFLRERPIGGRVFRRLVDGYAEADLASYLLFDGKFAAELIALGRDDARAHRARLLDVFGSVLESRRARDQAA